MKMFVKFVEIADGSILFVEISATTKDLLGNLKQNSEGALRQKISAMDFLPQLVENPCIKKCNNRCVTIFNFCNCSVF